MGEFDRSGKESNFNTAIARLRGAGFSEEYVNNFKIILWDIPNGWYGRGNSVKFEDFADAPNFFYMSGYDPAAVAFILGKGEFEATPRNAEELMQVALDQELLNLLRVVQKKKVAKRK